jgi:hypothetical protein
LRNGLLSRSQHERPDRAGRDAARFELPQHLGVGQLDQRNEQMLSANERMAHLVSNGDSPAQDGLRRLLELPLANLDRHDALAEAVRLVPSATLDTRRFRAGGGGQASKQMLRRRGDIPCLVKRERDRKLGWRHQAIQRQGGHPYGSGYCCPGPHDRQAEIWAPPFPQSATCEELVVAQGAKSIPTSEGAIAALANPHVLKNDTSP